MTLVAPAYSGGAVPAGGGAGVRGIQLADHLVDDVHQLVAVGDIGHQRLVLGRIASQSVPWSFGS